MNLQQIGIFNAFYSGAKRSPVQVIGLFPSPLRPDAKTDPVGDVWNMNMSANEMKGLL
jgi:hypothetical protein